MIDTAYERVIRALRDNGCKVLERNGERAEATCPSHEDRNASLSVTGITGQTLVHCHAGCDYRDVLASVQLTPADLYDEKSATYRYDDGRTVRRFYDDRGKKRFVQTGAGPASTLYHLTRLAEVPPGDACIHLVEGEKDVHAIEAAGGVATTAPQGADSFHKVDVTPLTGHNVAVVVDRDNAGHKWASQVMTKLAGVAKAVRFFRAKEGKDAADHIAAGHGLADFERYDPFAYGDYFDGHAALVPAPLNGTALVHPGRLEAHMYARSELSRIKPPGWLIDGVMTRASLTLLSGKFGTYKSFVSVALAGSVATGRPFLGHRVAEQGPVIYIAAEGASGARGRFEAWEHGYNDGLVLPDSRLVVIGTAANILNADDMADLRRLCTRLSPRLIVWDTLHRCAPGLDENSSQEAGQVVEALARLREDFDCTQLVNHHTGHGGVRARGSSSWEDDFDNSWAIKLGGDGEDRSPENQRTLIHRKVKDGDLSPQVDIGLEAAPGGVYVDRKTVGGGGGQARKWLVVDEYAKRLDEADVPRDAGRVAIAAALAEMGFTRIGHSTATKIAKYRQSPTYVLRPSPSRDVPGTS